jgi:hypothetical protein
MYTYPVNPKIILISVQTIYDIVKAHGGELKVETKVDEGNPDTFGKGEGTEFNTIACAIKTALHAILPHHICN